MRFTATYQDSSGATRRLELTATSLHQARRQLRRRNVVPLTVTATPAGEDTAPQGWRIRLERQPDIRERAVWASQLSALVDAGIPIVRCLDLVAEQQKRPSFKRAIRAVAQDVNQGASIAAAMGCWPNVFDRLTVTMVEAGEAGGILGDVLSRLAKVLEDHAKLDNNIKGAISYPLMILAVAVLVFLGMTIFLIPTFSGILEQFGGQLPVLTQVIVHLSNLLRSVWAVVLLVVLIAAGSMLVKTYRTVQGRQQFDAFVLRLPLFGDLLRKAATAQFCRTFACLAHAGVPILAALDILQNVTGNAIMQHSIQTARHDIQQGIPLSESLQKGKAFPHMALSMISIGEETGKISDILTKVADFYDVEVSVAVKTLTGLLEPMMIIVVGGIVGAILLAMYLPMFAVFDQIQ